MSPSDEITRNLMSMTIVVWPLTQRQQVINFCGAIKIDLNSDNLNFDTASQISLADGYRESEFGYNHIPDIPAFSMGKYILIISRNQYV